MEKANVKFNISFKHPVEVFALIQGGCLPTAFLGAPELLVDRNITSMLKQIGVSKDRGDHQANDWWLSFLNSPSRRLNPCLSALEGSSQRFPSYNEFIHEFEEESKHIRENLPKCDVTHHTHESYKATYAMASGLAKNEEKESRFLIEVMPHIKNRVSSKNTLEVESQITNLALDNGIPLYSFPVLASLSCLYDDKRGEAPSIGRKILKPSPTYTMVKAYNALSDLRCLNLLNGFIILGGKSVAFITRDKALADFWRATNPTNQRFLTYGGYNCNIELSQELLPRLSLDEIGTLKNRLDQLEATKSTKLE